MRWPSVFEASAVARASAQIATPVRRTPFTGEERDLEGGGNSFRSLQSGAGRSRLHLRLAQKLVQFDLRSIELRTSAPP